MQNDAEVALRHDLGTCRTAGNRLRIVLKEHWQNDSLQVYIILISCYFTFLLGNSKKNNAVFTFKINQGE